MFRRKLFLPLLFIAAQGAWADIVMELGPLVAVPGVTEIRYDFTGFEGSFEGTALLGQSQSIDLSFSTPTFTPPYAMYDTSLIWYTDFGKFPGFMQPGTGFLFGDGRIPLTPVEPLGRASSSDGSLSAGVIVEQPLLIPDVVKGVHFDVVYPDLPGYHVTGTTLLVRVASVPDTPVGLFAFVIMIGCIAYHRYGGRSARARRM